MNRLAHAAIVSAVEDVLPETGAGCSSDPASDPCRPAAWTGIREHGGPALLGAHLARLGENTDWKDG